MAKEYTEQNFQEYNTTERNLDVTVADRLHASCAATEVQQECNKDATLELPATKSATAKHFDISRTGLDRWITALEGKGYQIIENKKVSESGFSLLNDLNISRAKGLKPSEFVESLSIVKPQKEESETITTSAIEVLGQNNLDLTIELPTHQGSEELIDLNALGIFGSEALTQAQEELAAQKQKLADTKVNLANNLLEMAKQAAMNQAAEETRKQLELEQACEKAFQQELHRLQAIENARLQARQAHQQIKQNLGKS